MKRRAVRAALQAGKLAPKKRFGQNFLVHQPTVDAIIALAAPDPGATIVELGVGLGALTIPLARRVKRVIGIEIDAGIVKMHEEKGDLPANVRLVHDDLLRTDFRALAEECGGRLRIIANLPYSISNPLLFKLVDHHDCMHDAVLMLQKEVADRLCASPGTKSYGVLSALLPLFAGTRRLMRVGPEQFHPRPKVESAVVRVDFTAPQEPGRIDGLDFTRLRRLVKGAFQQRRKTLVNSLAAAGVGGGDKPAVRAILDRAGIAPDRRADQLSAAEYAALCRAWLAWRPGAKSEHPEPGGVT